MSPQRINQLMSLCFRRPMNRAPTRLRFPWLCAGRTGLQHLLAGSIAHCKKVGFGKTARCLGGCVSAWR